MIDKITVTSKKDLQDLTTEYREKGFNIITYGEKIRELEKDNDLIILEYESRRAVDFEVMTIGKDNSYKSYIVRITNNSSATDKILNYFNKRGRDVVRIEKAVKNVNNPAPIKI